MPTIEIFKTRELGPKSWGTELLIAETKDYIGKVMWMREGFGGNLQFHEKKDETFYLLSGHCLVRYHDSRGELAVLDLRPGMSIHVPPGAVHQVEALIDSVLVEASTPVFEDRVTVEAFVAPV